MPLIIDSQERSVAAGATDTPLFGRALDIVPAAAVLTLDVAADVPGFTHSLQLNGPGGSVMVIQPGAPIPVALALGQLKATEDREVNGLSVPSDTKPVLAVVNTGGAAAKYRYRLIASY